MLPKTSDHNQNIYQCFESVLLVCETSQRKIESTVLTIKIVWCWNQKGLKLVSIGSSGEKVS